jgi:hypothetical protein
LSTPRTVIRGFDNLAYYRQRVDASAVINATVRESMPARPLKSGFSALESGSPQGTTDNNTQ